MNGHDLHEPPLRLVVQPKRPQVEIVTTKRVGISQAKETLWRYYLQGNPYVSGKHRHIDK
jgi:3-methyladenine DNA glycosylase Mpg